MTLFAPATLAGLVVHNVRVAWRMRAPGLRMKLVSAALIGIYVLGGVALSWVVRDMPIAPTPDLLTMVFLAALIVFSFALSQSLSRAEQTLYGSGDLDLLLGAPIATRIVLWSKLIGIAASVLLAEATFILPLLVPLVVLGHPALGGALLLLVAIVLVATCLGLALMLAIVRLAGPRAARAVAQVLVALLGGAMVISTQVLRYGGDRSDRVGFMLVYGWARAHHLGQAGWASLVGRAAFGNPAAIAGLSMGAVALFGMTGLVFERNFLAAFQQAGQRATVSLWPRRVAHSGMQARFSASLVRVMLGKELALLLRNPQLLATMLLRLVYLAPLMLVVLQQQGVVLPAVAFVGVFVTTQVTGDIAWLVISGEDTPDLMAVAPIAKATIGRAKAAAAVIMAAPLLGLVALGLAVRAPVLIVVVVPLGIAGSAAAAGIQLALERPTPRKNFGRRTKGASIAANLLVMLVALALGIVASGAAWWLMAG